MPQKKKIKEVKTKAKKETKQKQKQKQTQIVNVNIEQKTTKSKSKRKNTKKTNDNQVIGTPTKDTLYKFQQANKSHIIMPAVMNNNELIGEMKNILQSHIPRQPIQTTEQIMEQQIANADNLNRLLLAARPPPVAPTVAPTTAPTTSPFTIHNIYTAPHPNPTSTPTPNITSPPTNTTTASPNIAKSFSNSPSIGRERLSPNAIGLQRNMLRIRSVIPEREPSVVGRHYGEVNALDVINKLAKEDGLTPKDGLSANDKIKLRRAVASYNKHLENFRASQPQFNGAAGV